MSYPKKQRSWFETQNGKENKLLSFTFPEFFSHPYYKTRKYRITIKYLNEKGVEKYKTVYFGKKNTTYEVEGGNKIKYLKKKQEDFFDPGFWEQNLLNNWDDLKKSFVMLVEKYL